MEKQLQKGQVLLIIVLVMVVALTVGLSVASRSLTNLRISTDDENSQRAFSAAEAGVERAVKGRCTDTEEGCAFTGAFTENNTTFETIATPILGTEFLLQGGAQIKQDEGADVWLSNYSPDPALLYGNQWWGTLSLHWGEGSNHCANAALQVMLLQGDKTNPQLTQYVYDPCATRSATNGFTTPTIVETSVGSRKFAYNISITIPENNKGLLMRVIPLYTNTTLGVKGSAAFPIQGQLIESIGRAGTGSEETVRKVNFTQTYATVPSEFFQYVLISP